MLKYSIKTRVLFGVMMITAAIQLAGCQTSPTGRKQLMMVPEAEIDQMGTQSFDDMKKKTPIETSANVNQYVKCVAGAITSALPEKENWEVVVFKDNQVNAFALPGAKIGVYSGLLKVANSADQLGAVLGHEVGHVLAKHGNERVSQNMIAEGTIGKLSSILESKQVPFSTAIVSGLGLGAQYGVLLPFGRSQESEADVIGLSLMAKAGFNPHEAIQLWKNMSANEKSSPPQFLSTHPSNDNRIANLNSHMAEAEQLYRASGKHTTCRM